MNFCVKNIHQNVLHVYYETFLYDFQTLCLPEKDEETSSKSMEVDMSVVFCVRIESYVSEDLHSDDGVDEKQHGDQQNDVRQSLKGLDEGPQKNANGVALPQ